MTASARSLVVEMGARTICTPHLWTVTRNGAVPHLTRETTDLVDSLEEIKTVLMPFNAIARSFEVIEKHAKGVTEFYGLTPAVSFITPSDPYEDKPLNNHNASVSMWHWGNRFQVDAEKFMKGVEACRPDAFVALCDGDTPRDSNNKRAVKAVNRSLAFLDKCIHFKSESKLLEKALLFGAVEGGYSESARRLSAKTTAERPVDGFLLDGFHGNGRQALEVDTAEVCRLLRDVVVPSLPDGKPRLYQGACDPLMIIELVECGVDMFDSTYAYLATEDGHALAFANVLLELPLSPSESLPSSAGDAAGPSSTSFTMDLNESKFQQDFTSLVPNCSCYTCRKHTRAYINHLLNTSEMLSSVLLMMHNLHHLSVFFQTIRNCIAKESLNQLKNVIRSQVDSINNSQ